MKGIPIKFRAKDLKSGKFVYGLINIDGDGVQRFIYDYHTDTNYLVAENTISQLIGYDADGNEVYEGDKLILGSHEYIAGIRLVSYIDDKKYYIPEKDFSHLLLKEV